MSRRDELQRIKREISSTTLPPEILINKRGHSRVAVRTVRDLEVYVKFVESLSRQYAHFYGHKKALAELIGVSANRINEWQRIWSSAHKLPQSQEVQEILRQKDISLSVLVDAIKKQEQIETSYGLPYVVSESSLYDSAVSSTASSITPEYILTADVDFDIHDFFQRDKF